VYGVTSALNLEMFKGAVLDHIAVARYVIAFCFDPEASLSVEGSWELLGPNGELLDKSESPDKSNADHGPLRIHACIGRAVCSAVAEPPRSIAIEFEEGFVLRIFDDSEKYESFHIQPGDIHV